MEINQNHYGSGDNVAGDKIIISNRKRIISNEQRNKIIKELQKENGKIGLVNRLMDSEGYDFAEEVNLLFKEAGWEVVHRNSSFLDDFPGDFTIFTTGKNLDEKANFIKRVFSENGFSFNFQKIREGSVSGCLPDTVYVVVLQNK